MFFYFIRQTILWLACQSYPNKKITGKFSCWSFTSVWISFGVIWKGWTQRSHKPTANGPRRVASPKVSSIFSLLAVAVVWVLEYFILIYFDRGCLMFSGGATDTNGQNKSKQNTPGLGSLTRQSSWVHLRPLAFVLRVILPGRLNLN